MILLAAGVAYATGVVFFGGNAHEDITDGLVLSVDLTQDNYISGTKTFTDDSSKKHNLVSANAATFTTDKYGKSTGAMIFSGTNDYLGNTANEPLNDKWTIAWWQYKKSVQGTLPTPIFIDDTSDGSDLWVYPTGDNLILDRNTGGVIWWNGVLSSDTWQYIVITFNFNSSQNTTTAYVNGVSQGAGSFPHLNMSVNNFLFGSYYGSFPFNGSISEVKIWNRDLSAAEVQTLYNSTKPKMSTGSISSGLVGHWALNSEGYNSVTGRVTDKTPYENHGTNSGANLTTDRMGQSNGAMYFDGSNYISVPYSFGQPNTISISAWFKTTSNGIIFDQHDSVYPPTAPSGVIPVLWVLQNGSLRMEFWMGTIGAIYSSTNFSDNNWHQAVAVGNTNIQYLYVDGALVGSRSGTLVQSWWELSTIGIGWSGGREGYGSGWTYFNGSIADVRIYNRALSPSEISTLYNSYNTKVSLDSLQKGLVLDMPLISSATKSSTPGSEIMTDKTPYSNDGQNSGATVGSNSTSFDGVNDHVNISSTVNNIRTISFWMKTNNDTNYPMTLIDTNTYFLSKWGYFSGDNSTRYINGVVATETLGSEKMVNSGFDSDLTGWAAGNGASAERNTSTYVSSPACAKITNPGPTQNDFYTPTYFSVTNGTLYKISFWAKGEDARQWSLAGNEWTTWFNIGLGYAYNITTNWKKYTYYAYAKKTTSNAYLSFSGVPGASQFILYVDDISVKPVTGDSATVNNGEWNHFVIVSNSSLYANQFIIGESKFGFTTGNYFNGSLSSLKIYNRALSDSEIKLLYDRGR